MKTIEEMLKVIQPSEEGKGGKFCNAIDEDPYDSSDWSDNMPSNGFSFFQGEDSVKVVYENYFACYDGWDMMDEDFGEFPDMYAAVKHIHDMLIEDDRIASVRRNIKFMEANWTKMFYNDIGATEAWNILSMLTFLKTELRYIK